MIKAIVFKNNKNELIGFKISGHAEFSEKGSDIVCSAVSAVAYTALGGMDEILGIRDYTEKDGYLETLISEDIDKNQMKTVQIILKTMEIGLKQIENSYKKYINVESKEE